MTTFSISVLLLLAVVAPSVTATEEYSTPLRPTSYVKALFNNIKCHFAAQYLGKVCSGAHIIWFQKQVTSSPTFVTTGVRYRLYIETCPQSYAAAVVFVPIPNADDPFPKVTEVSSILEPGPVIFTG